MKRSKTKNSTRSRRVSRLYRPLGALLVLAGCLTAISCLPAGYDFQIQRVTNCGASGQDGLSSGILDVTVSDAYQMSLEVSNWLGANFNPDTYTPETNYIELRRAEVSFTYPEGFTVPPSAALHKEDNPMTVTIYGRVDPSVVVGQQTGAGSTGTANLPVFQFGFILIPSETILLWRRSAAELGSTPPKGGPFTFGPNFRITANVRIFGQRGIGGEISTPMLRFPITICKGCLNATQKPVSSLCASNSGITSGSGSGCAGQDGICLSSENTDGGNEPPNP